MKRKIILPLVLILLLMGCENPLDTDKTLTDSTLIHQDNAKETSKNNAERIAQTVSGEIKTTKTIETAETKETTGTTDTTEDTETTGSAPEKPVTDKQESEASVTLKAPELIGTRMSFNSLPETDEAMIRKAEDMSLASPFCELDIYRYSPQKEDSVSYIYSEDSTTLFNTMKHKGFSGLEIDYEHERYEWDEFMGDITCNEYKKTISVSLKGDNIYEEEIIDEYAKFYRYFYKGKGVFYEVQDTMLGNYSEPAETLTRMRIGMSCNYMGLENIRKPTYNPFLLEKDEDLMNCYITLFNDEPCVFLELNTSEKLYKRWISIRHGVVIKELVFSHKGVPIENKTAASVIEKTIDDALFQEPEDVDYKDITLFIFKAEGGDFASLDDGIYYTIPEEATGIVLTGNHSQEITIYTGGMNGFSLRQPLYVTKYIKNDGTELTIKNIRDDRFYTIIDELKTIEVYDESCFEDKFFNFEEVGLIGVSETDNQMIYTFYDPKNLSVSGLYKIYEYVIEDKKIVKINTYMLENIMSQVKSGEEISYTIDLIPFDRSIFDESCMTAYEMIDHGEGSINDGEHMPFWME